MSDEVTLKISNCKDCPKWSQSIWYCMSGFDQGRDWYCAFENKVIAEFIQSNSEAQNVKIPSWCPLRKGD